MKALIIDDSRFSRSAIVKWFRSARPQAVIIEATGGKEGMELFDREAPELVVTDLVMPGVTGEQVIRHIRSQNPDCFIGVLSANIQTRVQDEMKAIGVDLFLQKPVNEVKIRELIDAFEQRRS